MTSFADTAISRPSVVTVTHMLSGDRMVMRLLQRLGAVSLAMVAFFVWFAPGIGWENDAVLLKMMVSISAALTAAGCWQGSTPPPPPTIEVDVAAGELRLIRESRIGTPQLLERCRFADLQLVELMGRHITFWGQGDRLLAEITLSNATAHASLLAALRAEGKLA